MNYSIKAVIQRLRLARSIERAISAAIWLWLCLKLRTSGVCTFMLMVIGAALMPMSGMMCMGVFPA